MRFANARHALCTAKFAAGHFARDTDPAKRHWVDMAVRRRSAGSGARPRRFRRTKLFVLGNLLGWLAIGGWFIFQSAERQADVRRLVSNAFDSRKQVSAFDVAWDLWQIYASDDYVAGIARGDRTYVYGGVPVSSRVVRVLPNLGYLTGYAESLGNPLWVAYHMRDVEVMAPAPRPETFFIDSRTTARVEAEDYARSGYDRGHLAPNYAIALRYGKPAQEETFLMSNIVPQRHALNAGLWKQLEQRVATSYPARFGEVWVVDGPVFGAQPEVLRHRVAIPEAFYMLIIDESEDRTRVEAFLFPQEAPEDAVLANYLTTVDEIEKRTGLDFFSELPDDAEAVLESRRAARVW